LQKVCAREYVREMDWAGVVAPVISKESRTSKSKEQPGEKRRLVFANGGRTGRGENDRETIAGIDAKSREGVCTSKWYREQNLRKNDSYGKGGEICRKPEGEEKTPKSIGRGEIGVRRKRGGGL